MLSAHVHTTSSSLRTASWGAAGIPRGVMCTAPGSPRQTESVWNKPAFPIVQAGLRVMNTPPWHLGRPYWPAFAKVDGAMPMNTDQHSPCVIRPQLNMLRRESKVVTHCCRQCTIHYLKKKKTWKILFIDSVRRYSLLHRIELRFETNLLPANHLVIDTEKCYL